MAGPPPDWLWAIIVLCRFTRLEDGEIDTERMGEKGHRPGVTPKEARLVAASRLSPVERSSRSHLGIR